MAIEVLPVQCGIESNADSLFETLHLELMERDSAAPGTPVAAKWRTLAKGDEIRVRLGLVGADLTDYGIFAVEEPNLRSEGNAWRSQVRAVSEYGPTIKERQVMLLMKPAREQVGSGRSSEGVYYQLHKRDWEYKAVSARFLAQEVAAKCGIAVRWEVDDYFAWLTIAEDSTAASVIEDLMAPLRLPRLYRADALLEGGTITVRRRDRSPIAGTIDCALGIMPDIRRESQREWKEVIVTGATYEVAGSPTGDIIKPPEEDDEESPYDFSGDVEFSGDPYFSGKKDPEKGDQWGDAGESHPLQQTEVFQHGDSDKVVRETVTKQYGFLLTADGASGYVILQSTSHLESTSSGGEKTVEIKETSYEYGVGGTLMKESVRCWKNGRPISYTLIEHYQITPTDIRTTTTEWGYDWDGNAYLKKGYPRWETRPGTLQSSVKQKQKEKKWKEPEVGLAPDEQESGAGSIAFQGRIDRATDEGTRWEEIGVLGGWNACQQLAQMLADECGKVCYTAELTWPRPFLYRRGQIVALTNLPGGAADVARAAITAVRTRFDREAATWEHAISLEWWADA